MIYWFNAEMKYREAPFVPEPFATATDAQIAEALQMHYLDRVDLSQAEGWEVGATRVIHLDAMQAPNPNSSNTWAVQDITVVIVAHDHTDLATPINGHTKAALTVQTKEVMNNCQAAYNDTGHIYVNGDSSSDMSFTKWSNLYMRTYLNSTVWGAFPSTFKASIKPSTHYRHTTYDGTASEQVTDNLFLPSYPEIYGTNAYGFYVTTSPVEGTQFEYYQTSTNRIKYGNNNGSSNNVAQFWWNGSPSSYYNSSYGYYWCCVNADGTVGGGNGNSAYGLAPAFCL